MTAPRQILPGATYLISRRCSERRFLLKPSAAANDAFRFILAVVAQRYGIQIHAFCFLSNHCHLLLTDPAGNLPDFGRDLGSLLARSTNARLGRWESFWAPNSYSAVALQTPDDIVSKTAYVLANPVAAGLVRYGREWPGLWSSPRSIGEAPIEARRPTTFFRRKGPLPESAWLRLTCPPGFASAAEFATAVERACVELEDEAARELAAEGRSFLGVAKVLAQKPFARPAPGEPRRRLNPRVASRDKWKRIEALQRLVTFLHDYREALGRWTLDERGARRGLPRRDLPVAATPRRPLRRLRLTLVPSPPYQRDSRSRSVSRLPPRRSLLPGLRTERRPTSPARRARAVGPASSRT